MMSNIEVLKQKILAKAFEGLLVKHDGDDEEANRLYQQIIYEQKKYDKKNINYFFDFKIEKVTIPKGWIGTNLNRICHLRRGSSPRPIKSFLTESSNGVNWIKIGDTSIGEKFINGTKEKITPEGARKSVKVYKGNLILSNSMSYGRPYILNIDGCIHDGWLGITFNEDYINKDYFYYYLLNLHTFFDNKAVGSGVKNLNIDRVKSSPFLLPPYEEQERIVTKIEELFAIIDAIDETKFDIIGRIQNIKQLILDEAYRGRLVENSKTENALELLNNLIMLRSKLKKEKKYKISNITSFIDSKFEKYDIPDNWCWTNFQQVTKIITDGTHKTPKYVESGIKFISIKNITKTGEISFSNCKYITKTEHDFLKKRNLIEKNDILFSRIGTLDKLAIVKYETNFNIFVSLGQIKLLEGIDPKYFYYYFMSPQHMNYINQVKVGGGTHTAKYNLSDVNKAMIPLAPLEEQRRIVKRIEELFYILNGIERSVS